MRILIVNQPLRNRGDESAHRAFMHALLKALPDATFRVVFLEGKQEDVDVFTVADPRVEYRIIPTGRLFAKLAFGPIQRRLPFKKLFWLFGSATRALSGEIRNADYVVCAPGGTCLGIQQNWAHLFPLYMALRMGKKTAYWGRSIGPFPTDTARQRLFRDYSVWCLQRFGFVALRDRRSMQLAAELGVNAVEITDSAFLEQPAAEIPGRAGNDGGIAGIEPPYAVFVPNVLTAMAGFKHLSPERTGTFFKEVLHIIRAFYKGRIIMLPQLVGQGAWNDRPFFEKVADGIPDVSVLPDSLSSDVQQKIISGADFLVGARYHSIVFALNNGTPFVAFSYEHKISGLLEILGRQEQMVDLQHGALDSPQSEMEVLLEFKEKFTSLAEFPKPDRRVPAAKVEAGFKNLIKYFKDNEKT